MYDESKHKRDKDGKFAKQDGRGYSDEVNERVKWAKDNGIKLPLNPDGSVNDIELRRLQKMSAAELSKVLQREVSDDKNIVKVNLDADIQKQLNVATTPKERQEIAFRYIMDNLRGKYPMHDGRTVAIERVGADKMTHTFDERKIRVLPELKTLLDTGRLRGVIDVKHKLFAQMAYYDVSFQINNDRYNARLNIGIRNNGDSTLYDIKPIEETKK